MAARRDRRKPVLPENIVTESDLQMKELLQKQINTDVTIGSQLSQVKSFAKSQVYSSPTDRLTGQVSLAKFSQLMDEKSKVDELRQFGLTDEEISVKLKHDETNTEKREHTQELKIIERKIAEKTQHLSAPTIFAGAKALSRHEMDLEQAVTQDRDATKVFRCLIKDRSTDAVDPDHPINHLDQIWKEVLSSKPTCRRRKRKRAAEVVKDSSCCEVSKEGATVTQLTNSKSRHGKDDSDKPVTEPMLKLSSSNKNTQPELCIEPVPVEVIERYRLSVDEIKQLSRFHEYSPGIPSPTLYLKNLSSRVTEADIVSLFIHFQKPHTTPIIYRLLRGRMKGQAFVTFDSIETASAALNLVNGYDFKGKPIIIAYAKRTEPANDSVANKLLADVTQITDGCSYTAENG